MNIDFRSMVDRDTASVSAALLLAEALEADIAERGAASLVASGGSTPAACYARLAGIELDWASVTVTLSDERWVDTDDPASNAAMLGRELLTGPAAAATFIPLYREGTDPASATGELDAALREHIALPFSATLLGMGADGHFASLFPDAATLTDGLDLDGEALSIAAMTAASPVPRISLTLPALLASRRLLLLIFGDDKREVLERAADGDVSLPVTRLLAQTRTPVDILWAP